MWDKLFLHNTSIDISAITNVSGVFGPQTEAAVRAFQSIRELGMTNPTGIVNRATWNRMSFSYSAVKRLGELTSEGIVLGIGRTPPTDIIREGARGRQVQQAQYLLNFISEFHPAVPTVIQNSLFTREMTQAVREFQRLFGLNPDGADVIIGLYPKSQQTGGFNGLVLFFLFSTNARPMPQKGRQQSNRKCFLL